MKYKALYPKNTIPALWIFLLLLPFFQVSGQTWWQEDLTDRNFWGPEQVDNRIKANYALTNNLGAEFMSPYFNFKDWLSSEYGLKYGMDYSAAYLQGTDTLGWQNAAAGIARLYFSWELLNRKSSNKGSLVFKLEHRHGYTAVVPKNLGHEIGYVGELLFPFSNEGLWVSNLYWHQRLAEGRVAILAGLTDATDYLDVFALSSPWTGFMNGVFGTGSQVTYVPRPAALGFAVAGYVTKHLYVLGSIADAAASPSEPWKSFETFFTNRDYFISFEAGYVRSSEHFSSDNLHLTLWHVDGNPLTDYRSGWGMSFTASWWFGEKWLPFLRGGFARDGGSILERSASAGFGYMPGPPGSELGLAVNWGRPNASTFGKSLPDQYSMEFYYRIQASAGIAVTPDIQFVINPAMVTGASAIFVWGLRGSLVF